MKVFFSGGATGGHLYPALCLAKAFESKNKEVQATFVVSQKQFEKKLLEKTKYKVYTLPSKPFQKSFVKGGASILALFFCVLRAFVICLKEKPQVIVGTGGYASVPLVLAGFFLRIPCFLWEANSYPGLANRFLSRFVRKAFVVFESSKKFLKTKNIEVCGYPLRKQIENLKLQLDSPKDKKEDEREDKGERDLFYVLVLGGSQGSHILNRVISQLLYEEMTGFHIIHQTGLKEFEKYKIKYKDTSFMEACAFFYNIEEVYKRADLVISRAGAGALFELACLGKPALFVPLPYVADDHQLKNAKEFAFQKACKILEQKDLHVKTLKKEFLLLKETASLRKEMSQNIKKFYKPFVAETIRDLILKALKKS